MKKTKLRKVSKTNTSAIRRKCVDLAKRIVRHRAEYRCEYCGNGEPTGHQTHGSHIWAEGQHQSMSADLDNIVCFCASHHVFGKEAWHESPDLLVRFLWEKYPDRMKDLDDRRKQTRQADKYYWTKKHEELKQLWKELIN